MIKKAEEKVVKKKGKYEVKLLSPLMAQAGGESRIERIENAMNSLEGKPVANFEFKGEIYIVIEK